MVTFSFRYIVKVSVHVDFMNRDRIRGSSEVSFRVCVQYRFLLGLGVTLPALEVGLGLLMLSLWLELGLC